MWRYGVKRGGSNIMVRHGYILAEKGRGVEMVVWERAASLQLLLLAFKAEHPPCFVYW